MPHAHGYQPSGTATPSAPPSEPAGASSAARHHRLAITAKAPGERSTVTLDGNDIAKALTGLTFTIGVGQVPTATLDLRLIDITEIQDAETRIHIPDATANVLTALGWTPPATPGAETSTDSIELAPYLVVHRYHRDHGGHAWVVRCWGEGDCDGHLALDLSDRAYAERKAREHLAAEHAKTEG